MTDAKVFLERLTPELLKVFSSIPEYGSVGFTVFLNEEEPVRVEVKSSESRKLISKTRRIMGEDR